MSEDQVELLPCPFCGAAPFEVPQNGQRTSLVQFKAVWCDKCKAEGPEAWAAHDDDAKGATEAIAAWNTRTSPPVSRGE